MRKRKWSSEITAYYAGIPPYFVDRILKDKKRPGFETAYNLANAFGISPVLMFEKAGLIPPLYSKPLSRYEDPEWLFILNQLSEKEANQVLDFARFILSQRGK
jgi:transcriptional regulator with XRE-family HTH domain